ncbi:DNA replication and repair protein RecF [Apibacter muscae]|uniref:DNA replication/repair protein RecF n=1 Tax=Apibacter muscae TaxID=2509004 RepID=UPI0011ACA944|nr:DNA replication and repair protein RecF [Apibacter muscae]TWP24305.1 DNA replication and repair protein RecF [Apibacter muscae]TWP30134.1 DNA replication and repair protein RecF [Apibacter muscae]
MTLESLKLFNFKNFEEKHFSFSNKINCLVGNNGKGKTNVLDAIYYLSLTKSYLNYSDQNNVRFGENFFSLEGIFKNQDNQDIIKLLVQTGQKKVLKKNNKSYEKLSEHIGKYPCVMISPYDQNLIAEGSEFRRKFMDNMICQLNPEYLHCLIRYQKVLLQRNALLKLFSVQNTFDAFSLGIYDDELIKNGNTIYKFRIQFIQDFVSVFSKYYSILSNQEESVDIQYISDLHETTFQNLLKENLLKDRNSTYTSKGIHKDDLLFKLFNHPIKKIGSQGQQKSFLISLKLAQLEIIKNYSKKNPILLMDDIFDKLDEERVEKLLKLVLDENFGQIFLSDTHKDRTESIIQNISSNYSLYNL